jgi:hypothetical protein
MQKYEDVMIEIVLWATDVIRTSQPGDHYEEDIDWVT